MKFIHALRRGARTCLLAGIFLGGVDRLQADQTVSNTTLSSGQTAQVTDPGKIGTAGTVEIQSGAKASYIGGVSVTLSPGFHAGNGSVFRATTDLNLAGLSSLVDSDFDGLPDEWELLHFGNLTAASGFDDSDGDGISNIDEYRAGTNPLLNELTTTTLPTGVQVVIRNPAAKYQGVKIDWSLISVP